MIADQIANHYQGFIKPVLNKYVYSKNRTGLIYISESHLTENSTFLQVDSSTVCFLVGTPTGLNRLFSEYDVESDMNNYLLRLKKMFENYGYDLIKRISPPFIFGFISNDTLRIVHDGLGFEQGFIYEDDDNWICSNKCWPILKFTGKKFHINNEGWKYRLKGGSFPLKLTPFREISFLGMGDVWSFQNGVGQLQSFDCFSDWIKKLYMDKKDILEFARNSFNECMQELITRYCGKQLLADLSGGRDTRLILSFFLSKKTDCEFKTVGDKYSADVKCVEMLQKEYSLKVRYTNPAFENIDENQVVTKICRSMQWQDGFGDFQLSKYMEMKPQDPLVPPFFSGLIGNFYRGYGYPRYAFEKDIKKKVKSFILKMLTKKKKVPLYGPRVKDLKKLAFKTEKKEYGLSRYSLIDCYHLAGKASRGQSAGAAFPFSGYLLPFLNMALIKVTFSLSEYDRKSEIMFKYILESNIADSSEMIYDTDLIVKDKTLSKTPYDENIFWRSDVGRSIMEKILNQNHYMWKNLLNKSKVHKMWKYHCSGKANHGEFFWKVAGFYFWYYQFSPHLKA